MYADDKKQESIHTTQWPTVEKDLIDPESEKSGDLILAVMGEIRRDKAENQKPLNTAIKKLTLYSEDKQKLDVLCSVEEDLAGTCKIEKMEVTLAKVEGREVQGYSDVRFAVEY